MVGGAGARPATTPEPSEALPQAVLLIHTALRPKRFRCPSPELRPVSGERVARKQMKPTSTPHRGLRRLIRRALGGYARVARICEIEKRRAKND